jgi:hypothetical protein
MGVFRDAEHLYRCIGGLFEWAQGQPKVREAIYSTRAVIRLTHLEPDAVITIDGRTPEVPIHYGTEGVPEPEVEFRMKADVAHRFWQGKVNLVVALTKREVTARGPITKVMKILPALKPLYEQYPKHLKAIGEKI